MLSSARIVCVTRRCITLWLSHCGWWKSQRSSSATSSNITSILPRRLLRGLFLDGSASAPGRIPTRRDRRRPASASALLTWRWSGECLDENSGRFVVEVDVVDELKIALHTELQLLVKRHQCVVGGAGNHVLRHAEYTCPLRPAYHVNSSTHRLIVVQRIT